ncbi:MAG: CDP-diacylglycerol--glycerol-3-phosphate 3-phosphatidyltransferase [Desulfobacteraceae bacterium]|nr:CDP-diacylglycerol--glycerol-3-phosphate 3-phosphatidyltransferase [Desulfobacteraceae bacterium]
MKPGPHKKISNLPNMLTLFRLACIPVVLLCLNFPGRFGGFLAALFLGLAFITDILDGFFARRYGAVTVVGKFLDPLADKILVSVTMIMLIPLGRIPVWMVIVIIIREIGVTGLRGIAVNEGIVIQASALGKYKTIFQAVALVGLCLHYSYLNINFHVVGMTFLWGALIVTLWSGFAYFRQFKQVIAPKKTE